MELNDNKMKHLIKSTFWLSFAIFCISCGARKVDKRTTQEEIKTETKDVVKTDLTIDSNTKIETKIITNDSTKEEIEETVVNPIDPNRIAIFGKDTLRNTSLTKRKIKRNKATTSDNNTIVSNETKATDKTVTESEKAQQTKKSDQTKSIDRKQFDFIGQILSYWWLFLIVALVIYLWKKYLEKIWFV